MIRVGLAMLVSVASVVPPVSHRRIDFDGLTPVRVGMTVAQAEQVLRAKLLAEFPHDSDSTSCKIVFVQENDPFSYMVENGHITRADLGGQGVKSAIRTVSGIGLGSTIGDVRRVYGRRARSHPDVYSDEPDFEVKSVDGKSAMIFETENGRVVRIHAGRLPSVEYIEGCE